MKQLLGAVGSMSSKLRKKRQRSIICEECRSLADARIFVLFKQAGSMTMIGICKIAKAVVVGIAVLAAICLYTKQDEYKED